MQSGKRGRQRVQFSLRSLLIVVALAALFFGWLGAGVEESRRQQIAVRSFTAMGGVVYYEDGTVEVTGESAFADFFGSSAGTSPWSVTPWWNSRRLLRWLTGARRFESVIQVVFPEERRMTDAQREYYCNSFRSVRMAVIWDCGLNDEQLRHLAVMRDLVEVQIDCAPITGEGLRHLKSLRRLRSLRITDVKLTEAGNQELGNLGSLTDLTVTGDDRTVAHLTGLTKLKILNLNCAKITDAGMVHLAKMPWLECLELSYTNVSDQGLRHLEGLQHLKVLSLRKTRVTDEGIVHLTRLPTLYCLDLCDTQVTDAAIPHLQKLKTLVGVDLSRTRVTDSGKKKLREALPNLKAMDSEGVMLPTPIDASGL